MVLLLRPDDMAGLLTMKEAIEAVEEGFRQWGQYPDINHPRVRIHAPSGVRVSVHQGGVPSLGATGLMTHCEWVSIKPDEHQRYSIRGRPVQVLFNSENGELMALLIGEPKPRELEFSAVSGLRTAANSAVGTHHLARPDARKLGIFGSFQQAKYHLVAFCAIRPIEEVKVYSPTPEHRRAFAEEMSRRLSIKVEAVDEPREVVRDVDIVLAATNSNVPVFDGAWLEEGQHVTSIVASNVGLLRGGFIAHKRREIDDTTLRRADAIAVNSREQIRCDEQGDFYDPIQAGVITWDKVWELSELITGQVAGRTSPGQITLFKNNAGQGVSDVALGATIYRRARENGLGIDLDIDPIEYRDEAVPAPATRAQPHQ